MLNTFVLWKYLFKRRHLWHRRYEMTCSTNAIRNWCYDGQLAQIAPTREIFGFRHVRLFNARFPCNAALHPRLVVSFSSRSPSPNAPFPCMNMCICFVPAHVSFHTCPRMPLFSMPEHDERSASVGTLFTNEKSSQFRGNRNFTRRWNPARCNFLSAMTITNVIKTDQ